MKSLNPTKATKKVARLVEFAFDEARNVEMKVQTFVESSFSDKTNTFVNVAWPTEFHLTIHPNGKDQESVEINCDEQSMTEWIDWLEQIEIPKVVVKKFKRSYNRKEN